MRGRVDRWVKEAADLAISACWLRMSHWLGKITISQPCFFFICIMGIIISLKLTAKFYKICIWKYKMSVHNEGDKKKKKKTRFQDNLSFNSNKVHMQSDFGKTKLFNWSFGSYFDRILSMYLLIKEAWSISFKSASNWKLKDFMFVPKESKYCS